MLRSKIAFERLNQQRLAQQNTFSTPAEVVDWSGAVQSQDYLGAKWSLGMRVTNASDETIERAFNEGALLRTHIMRPTWHFVTPADIRWIQELTSPRVNAGNAYMYRRLELDEALLQRCNDLLARALEGGKQLTREELGTALARDGVTAEGQRLGYIIHHAELDVVVCSGPRRGKQFTYMLLAERAPEARRLSRDEALTELTRRYYTGHGPATVKDLAWWSGLTIADVNAGIAMLGKQLGCEEIEGQAYYFSAAHPPQAGEVDIAILLPTYDEYLIGYSNFDRSRTSGQEVLVNLIFDSTIVYQGRIIGTWRRTFQKGAVMIELAPFAPFAPFTSAEEEAVSAAAERYGKFVGLPVECTYVEERK